MLFRSRLYFGLFLKHDDANSSSSVPNLYHSMELIREIKQRNSPLKHKILCPNTGYGDIMQKYQFFRRDVEDGFEIQFHSQRYACSIQV